MQDKQQWLHFVRFRSNQFCYITRSTSPNDDIKAINKLLYERNFYNKQFQEVYDSTCVRLGLANPDPNDVVFHQSMYNHDQDWGDTLHWYLRRLISSDIGLHEITNIGDLLSIQGYVKVSENGWVRVTDVGKYLFYSGNIVNGLPYSRLSELPPDRVVGTDESHRQPQPPSGYSNYAWKRSGKEIVLLDYTTPPMCDEPDTQEPTNDRPVMADELVYSSVDELAAAKNVPVWFVINTIHSEQDTGLDWHYI